MSPVSGGFPNSLSVITIMSKSDLADAETTSEWVSHFKARGRSAWALDLRRDLPGSLKKYLLAFRPSSSSQKIYRDARVAVVGTPNVGKSMFLNRLVGRRAAAVGGVPGVTRGVSWFSGPGYMVADSPGILDPHSDARAHRMLSWLSSTKGQIIGSWDDLALECVSFLRAKNLCEGLLSAWGINASGGPGEILERIGRRLGKLLPGGEIDRAAAGRAFIDALACGKLGRLSLERPDSPLPWSELA
jgi:ribosome biogenesis GTPase A